MTTPRTRLGVFAVTAMMAVGAPALSGGTAAADPGTGAAPPSRTTTASRAGTASRTAVVSRTDAADRALAARAGELRKGPWDAFERPVVTAGPRGLRYLLYRRTHRGLPVYGGDVIVVTDGSGAVVHTVTTGQRAVLNVATVPRVGAGAAAAAARAGLAAVREVGTPRLLVHATTERPRLAWEVTVGAGTDLAPKDRRVFVDALDGTVFESEDLVRYGLGHSYYNGDPVTIQTAGGPNYFVMSDPTRPSVRCDVGPLGITKSKMGDDWGDGTPASEETACVDAVFGAQKQWDMLRDWFGRSGTDGQGHSPPARLMPDVVGSYLSGWVALGRNQAGTKWVTSLDMVGHEYGHRVFLESGSGWSGSSGGDGQEHQGLNESSGDIFATLLEHYVNHPAALDEPDYLIGEEVDLLGNGPIRNLYDPAQLGDQNCYTPYTRDTGPQNHWFYLLAEGTNPSGKPASPVCSGPSTLTGIGIRKAGEIFYNGIQLKTAPWNYAKARLSTVQAALTLYPGRCTEVNAVKAAWAAVNVPAKPGEPACA
ncbi:M4 family metallopeptidase [Streptosporangium sp. NPDC051022]|uniref:M4 family metallopeptidase n=1 Tax=Streptosporangium sp. NPDC051022 TaxID=3155752 RepID=UPI00343798E7